MSEETADDLIMQQGGTSDLDRAKRIIDKQRAKIEQLRADNKVRAEDARAWSDVLQDAGDQIKRLRAKNEALDQERFIREAYITEVEKAARWCYEELCSIDRPEALERWPWLEEK